MAEIRKFNPAAPGTIGEALRRAMGDSVRPVTAGSKPSDEANSAAEPPAARWYSVTTTRRDEPTS